MNKDGFKTGEGEKIGAIDHGLRETGCFGEKFFIDFQNHFEFYVGRFTFGFYEF